MSIAAGQRTRSSQPVGVLGRPSAETLRSRGRLLGYAGWIAAGCLAFNVVGTLLSVLSDLAHHRITGVDVSDGFAFLATPLAILAAGCVGAAYLGPRENRRRRLFSGALAFGFSNAAVCVSLSVEGGLFASHHFPGTETAAVIAGAVGQAVIAAAFVAGAGAFEGSRPPLGRDRRLGIAAAIYAAAMLVSIVSVILLLVAAQDVGASSAQFALVLAGSLIELPVAGLVAFAFLRSARSQRLGQQDWLLTRDRFLAGGFSALVLANLLEGIGSLVAAGHDGYLYGLDRAAKWVGATGDVTLVAAFACAAAAFLISGWRSG